MRRIGRLRRRKLNRIIVLSAFCLLFVITAGYAAFSTNISLHVKGNILEGTRVIQEWDENSQTDFHSDFYKQNIVSITFLNNNVPENAVESWNVSEDKEKGTVKAWVVPNSSDSSKYDLYIGAKGKVIANEDSSNIFYDFRGVKEINFDNNYDTSNAIDMSRMFLNCTSLTELDLTSFDTSNVTSMYAMFCMWDSVLNLTPENKLEHIKFGHNFITDNVTNMRSMFAGLTELKELDLSNFNTKNVTTMYHMFTGCNSLTELDLSSFDTSKVTDMEQMFAYNVSLKKIIGLENFNTGNVTTMREMFDNCNSLTDLNVSSFNTNKVTTMRKMFNNCNNLTSLDVSNFDTSNVIDMSYMFSMTDYNSAITTSGNLTKLDLSSFNTSKVTNMSYMFAYNKNLKEIIFGDNFDTSNVTTMESMFSRLQSIKELNLCSFNTSKVTDMAYMFDYGYKLEHVYVGAGWNTSNVINSTGMWGMSNVSDVTRGQC